jgi:hypothetical protein
MLDAGSRDFLSLLTFYLKMKTELSSKSSQTMDVQGTFLHQNKYTLRNKCTL